MPDEYLDRFTDIRQTLFATSHFDEYCAVSTTYLGRLMKDQRKDFLLREFSSENDIQLNAFCMATGCLLDQSPVRMLFDTGASKIYMSKLFYMVKQSLHKIPKFCTSSKGLKMGNRKHVPVLFVILVVVKVSGHLLEICTIAAEIHEGIDSVWDEKCGRNRRSPYCQR